MVIKMLTVLEDEHTGTVLVVDDERHIVNLLRDLLEDEGYTVLSASDGEKALQVMDRQMPDLVVADVMMPRMDGPNLVHAIHAQYKNLPVILMSAARDPKLPDATFLAKPFDINDMLDLIESQIATH
jgi:DNA-binding NtrC family response regulator